MTTLPSPARAYGGSQIGAFLAVLRPLKVVITNLPEGHTEELAATNNPQNPDAGTRSRRGDPARLRDRAGALHRRNW